jgi:membrane fusion protein (multidrug efflux system)
VLEKKYVFVVGKDSIAKQREIVIASELPDIYILREGLKENERIILEGIRKVSDGDKITFTFEDPKTVLPKLKIYVE